MKLKLICPEQNNKYNGIFLEFFDIAVYVTVVVVQRPYSEVWWKIKKDGDFPSWG